MGQKKAAVQSAQQHAALICKPTPMPAAAATKSSSVQLTAAQERFCQVYIATNNAAKAYREAYPKSRKWQASSVYERASVLKASIKILTRIAELQAQTAENLLVSDESVVKEFARIAFSDIRRLFEGNVLKNIHDLDDDTAAAVANVKAYSRQVANNEYETVTEIKLWPKGAALDALSKHLGLFNRDNSQKRPLVIIKDFTGSGNSGSQ